MTTQVQNSDAINETLANKLFAIFFREGRPRYAIRQESPYKFTTLVEVKGGWEVHDTGLATWCIHHTDLQGFDDLSKFL